MDKELLQLPIDKIVGEKQRNSRYSDRRVTLYRITMMIATFYIIYSCIDIIIFCCI